MSATSSSSDKFAFLFRTGSGFDLSEVMNTLKDQYGYLPVNITESTGCANLVNDFKTFSDAVASHAPTDEVPAIADKKNSVIIFIAGSAVLNGLGDGTILDWATLGYAFDVELSPGVTYYQNSEVHFYLIFPFCDSFVSNLTFFPNGTISMPVTNNFSGFNTQSTFITQWKETFNDNVATLFSTDPDKMLRFNVAAQRIFSLYSVSPSTIDTFYKQVKNSVFESSTIGFSAFYPGRPSLEIEDGNPVYKTTDIFLNNKDPEDPATVDPLMYDDYEYDHDNKISVRVHIRGTHPVKSIYVGVGVFRNGGGGECDVNLDTERLTISSTLLNPGDVVEYSYNKFFQSTDGVTTISHRCIKARVNLTGISTGDIDNDYDWLISARPNEAQLNIDPGGIADISAFVTDPVGGANPAPGEGIVDETDPAEDAETDATGTGSKSTNNLRGYFEHVYLIKNRFKTKMEFRYRIPDILFKYENLIICRWFALDQKETLKMNELVLKRRENPWFSFVLMPGEQVEIMTFLALKSGAKIEKRIDLPFDILVEKPGKNFFMRLPLLRSVGKQFRLFSGVNLVLSKSSGDIFVKVLDEKMNPVIGAFVFIKTFNGRQSAVCRTGKDGTCVIPKINTGPYKLWATKDKWKSGIKVVNLHNNKREKIELVPESFEKK